MPNCSVFQTHPRSNVQCFNNSFLRKFKMFYMSRCQKSRLVGKHNKYVILNGKGHFSIPSSYLLKRVIWLCMFGHLKWCPLKLFCLYLPFNGEFWSLIMAIGSFVCVETAVATSLSWSHEQPSSSQGSLAGHSRLWHLRGNRGWVGPCTAQGALSGQDLGQPARSSGFVFSPHRAPVPTKRVALKCSVQSRKRKHQGNAGAGIRRRRRLVMRSELCVLGKLIRWLSLIRDWPGTVWGDNRCPQDTMGGELRPRTHTEGGNLHLTKWIF